MEYHTPGVYIREVDSGPKPIASVSTSVPGFLGLFEYRPPHDAVAVTATDGTRKLRGKLSPALLGVNGDVRGDAKEAGNALVDAFKLKRSQVRDVRKYLEVRGAPKTGAKVPKFEPGTKGRVKVTYDEKSIEVAQVILDERGVFVTTNDALINETLDQLDQAFALPAAMPKSAAEVLEVYGFQFSGAEGTALKSEYSIPPVGVTNKAEFFRWLQSFFAQYLLETRPVEELVGQTFDDVDEAADAVFEALGRDEALKQEFREFLSQPTVFNFVSSVNGFYDNGGGKCYVYLMGVADLTLSIRENQADKLGLYAFDDIDDMALMASPGLSHHQQREMLEHCELRKDRFAILKVTGPNRRKLIKTERNELFVPPSGHVAGIFARVDSDRGVHKAPANELVMGITGLTQNINRIEQGQYNDRGINAIRSFKDRGVRVWGARTLATASDPSWKYINVRRLFIMIEQSIMLGSQWAVFEPNDHTLWKKLTRDVRSYLMRVWRSGALFGATAEEAFYVKCDEETNPRYLIDAGQVNVQIGICPVKPAEFVIFSIGQWDGGGLIEEV